MRKAYLTAECEECADDLGNILLFPKVDCLEHVDVRDTVRFDGPLEAARTNRN